MKNVSKALGFRLVLKFILSIIIFIAVQQSAPVFASVTTTAAYDEKVQEFISDSRWSDGKPWEGIPPKLSTYICSGCAAYCADFCAYVYSANSWNESGFQAFTSVNDIQSGDIIHLNNSLSVWGHWFVVLGRQGNNLWTAEGNYGSGVVKIANYENPEYVINNGKLTKADGTELAYQASFDCGYHCNDETYIKTATLESISVTTKTDPLIYQIGDSFNPSDIVVNGTFSDGTSSQLTITRDNIIDFDSSKAATEQLVTVKVDDKLATFKVKIESESTEYTYKVNKITGEASITDYIGPDPNGTGVAIEIPSAIGIHPVTSIASLGGHGTNFNPSGKKITSVTVPEGVTRIELGAFSYDDCLNHISLPNSLTYIGDMAFQMNFGLNNVIIPDNVTFIGPSAFYACWSLNNITLPKDLTRIEDHVFMGCKSLTNIAIPDNVTYIGYQSFASCSKLTNIFIPDKVTYIGPQAFASSGLTNITIPSNISIIRIMAFQECYSLKSIVFKSENTIIEDENIGGLEPKFYTIPEVTTVIGYEGSTSEKYATNLNHIRAFRTIIPGLPIVVLDARSPNTEVTSDSVQVVVLSEVANGTLITTPENGHVTVPEVRISSDVTNSGEVIVSLSDGTTITGPANWDGTIYLPQVTSSGSSEAIRKYPLLLSEGVSFEIGLADESLNFDQPVRIAIQGQGGQSAGLVRTDGFNFEFIPIKYRMDSDSADALGANNEGYLNVGSDLVIWTTHFTTFVAYTETSLTGFTLSGQVLVEGDDLTEGQTHYSGGVSIELKQGEEIKYSATTSEAKDLASNGSFRITGIEDGEYTVVISKAGYLTRSFNLSINSDLTLTTTSSQYLNRIYLWAGDIVNDEYNVIAASDVNYILSKFNSNSTQAGFDPQADIVKDQYDVISAADINLMLSNFNKNSTQYPADIIY